MAMTSHPSVDLTLGVYPSRKRDKKLVVIWITPDIRPNTRGLTEEEFKELSEMLRDRYWPPMMEPPEHITINAHTLVFEIKKSEDPTAVRSLVYAELMSLHIYVSSQT